MIVRMQKVWLVILESEKTEALRALRKLGVVHIETGSPRGDEHARLAETRDAIARALNIVEKAKASRPARLAVDEAVALARQVIADTERNSELLQAEGALETEIERCRRWGDFLPADVSALGARGIPLRFFEVDAKALSRAEGPHEYMVLASEKGRALVAALGLDHGVSSVPSGWVEFALPKEGPEALRSRLAALKAEGGAIAARLADASLDAPSLVVAGKVLDQDITFETVRDSFAVDGPVSYVKGFVPEKEAAALAKLAKDKAWGYLMDEPSGEDATPTKVENGPIVRMIDPVFAFLGITPGYNEYELSNWLLVYLSIFFAMIFGDGGYGLVMFLVVLALAIKAKVGKGFVPDVLRLFLVFTGCTIIWGAVTATWFSIPAANLPRFLVDVSIWPISSANPAASKNVQVFCFLLGAMQIGIAHIKNIIRDFPSPKIIAQFGSLSMATGMLFLVLNLVVDAKRFPVPSYTVWLVLGGFIASMMFGAYNGSLVKSLLEGLRNIVPNFLGAVGFFADIVSYIRLWAVGLAGASLATIINGMGGGLFKSLVMAFAGAALLLVGHTLNMVLSALSVVVHGIRLNILEFSSHLGMEWSGIRYDPFRVTAEKSN